MFLNQIIDFLMAAGGNLKEVVSKVARFIIHFAPLRPEGLADVFR
jgi:hypothetical protein